MYKRLITAALAITAILFAASAEAKHGKMIKVEMVKSQEVTMEGGKSGTVYVVKMRRPHDDRHPRGNPYRMLYTSSCLKFSSNQGFTGLDGGQ